MINAHRRQDPTHDSDGIDAVNDNSEAFDVAGGTGLGLAEQQVISAALLVATAFRLRDEAALVQTLRRLTDAVERMEDHLEG
ncbi:MAG: hypothetical protein KDE35_10225 [Geminicoccaceae bacterium]|nr:hypothetical protein [Geminicoccaceae bacterium]